MTCIIWNPGEGVIAYDSRVTQGDEILTDNADKKHRIGERYFFNAGDADDAAEYAFMSSMEFREKGAGIEISAIMVEGSRVYACGSTSEKLWRYDVSEIPYSIGSGGKYAMGALLAGATAVQAVKIAAMLDTGVGGRVRTFTIKQTG